MRLEATAEAQVVSFISWDTEGGDRLRQNLLRSPVTHCAAAVDHDGGFSLTLTAAELHLPFDQRVTSTRIIPARWNDDGSFELPAIINAPDFGAMTLTSVNGAPIIGRFEGSRKDKIADIILHGTAGTTLAFKALILEAPAGLKDASLCPQTHRGWLNIIQPTSQWGEQGRPFSAPPGMLGNNAISDPASCSLWFYADQALFIPEPAPGASLMPLVRRTIEYWLDTKMLRDAAGHETGELICYWNFANFLDANAGQLIAAWDYVEAAKDHAWLAKKSPASSWSLIFLFAATWTTTA